MSKRQVTAVSQSAGGYVTALCNPDETWSPLSARDAVFDVELGLHSYFIVWHGERMQIETVDDAGGRYLRCDPDNSGANALLTL